MKLFMKTFIHKIAIKSLLTLGLPLASTLFGGCTVDFMPQVPPINCVWDSNTEAIFYEYLRAQNGCFNLYPSIFDHPFPHPWNLYNAAKYAEDHGMKFLLTWQTVGDICQKGTEKAPLIEIKSSNLLNRTGDRLNSYYTQSIFPMFIEHELIVQMGPFEDLMTDRKGILMWEKMYHDSTGVLTYTLDIEAQFVPIEKDRPIYVHNSFTIF